MIPDAVLNIGLGAIRKVTDALRSSRADSLIDYTRAARVEPIALIDSDCVYHEATPDVMQSLQSMFAGYYLQAVAISTQVGHIDVGRHLDRLNPNRNAGDSAMSSMGWLLAAENYKHRLPTYDNPIAMESLGDDLRTVKDRALDRLAHMPLSDAESGVTFGKDAVADLKELANLSVGKMLNVKITDGDKSFDMPISIRLMASSLPTASLIHILSLGNKDNSIKERYHAWKAGRLRFIEDLILCQDLVDAHRKNLMGDKDGIYSNLVSRASGNKASGLLSGNPSVATASNLVVMSRSTADQLEMHTNMKLSRFADREKLFKPTYVMIMAVIDKQWDRVTFYHRGVNGDTTVSTRELKVSNRGNGPDVSDILKAYQLGNSPSI
jgi:hypothetical protein